MVTWRGGGMPKDGYLDILPANEICFDRECFGRAGHRRPARACAPLGSLRRQDGAAGTHVEPGGVGYRGHQLCC